MKLYSPAAIRDIKDRYGFKLSKSLGQNFLTDKNIIDKIIESSLITKDDIVIEIGPGIGVLTAEAAQAAGRVIAVEIDKNLIPILKETLSEYDNVEVINQDILKTDLNRILDEHGYAASTAETAQAPGKDEAAGGARGRVRIIGNLPYYITTPIIMKLLEDGVRADSITIMMQKEVADRIKAEPGTKAYGALSLAVQYYCTVEAVAKVPKEVFLPQPKVDSAVLRLDIRSEKPVKLTDERVFFACIKAGFGQRRKTLLNSLTGVRGMSKEQISKVLETAGIDPVRRAETLSLEEFALLANTISAAEASGISEGAQVGEK